MFLTLSYVVPDKLVKAPESAGQEAYANPEYG